MIFYILYKIGKLVALILPLRVSYGVACVLADLYYYVSPKDRAAVAANLKIISAVPLSDNENKEVCRKVFRNFAKYLVEFFRFSLVNREFIRKFVKIEGLYNVDMALANKKGAIMLSAHIGNWELGGLVLSSIRHPMGAVVLTHQNEKINDFFTTQRSFHNMKVIEIGMPLREGFKILKANGLLALLGDRDFSKNGLYVEFFGKRALIPKGPAVLSYRTGAAIVPTFMIREKDGTFKFVFESPIFPDTGKEENSAVSALTHAYSAVIESYVKRYPEQWYVFKNVWDNNEKSASPDTII